jgi:hypothetical protein
MSEQTFEQLTIDQAIEAANLGTTRDPYLVEVLGLDPTIDAGVYGYSQIQAIEAYNRSLARGVGAEASIDFAQLRAKLAVAKYNSAIANERKAKDNATQLLSVKKQFGITR